MRYQIHKGCKRYGVNSIFENIQFEIRNNEKIAIVGRNGCGKTTLLKIIAEVEEMDQGDIHKENNTKIGYLAQTTFEEEDHSVYDELKLAFKELGALEAQMHGLSEKMLYDSSEEVLNAYARVQQRYEEQGGYSWEADMKIVFSKFGFSEDQLERKISTFSGGQKTRLAFVKLLLSKPDILLLDEPTNHLDLSTIEWLEGYVKRYPKAVVLVSHDRMFLDDVCDVIYEIEYGVMSRYPGNYSHYVEVKDSDLERVKSAYAAQQKEIARMEELIEKFRYKKNKAAFAQSKIKYLDRMEKIEDPKSDTKTFKANFTTRIKGGKRVLEVKDLVIGYDHPLCKINLEIMQGDKIAVIGPNGKGKSTFVKTIMNKLAPLSGSFLLGHQIETGYFDQELAQFNTTKTVLEEIWDEYPSLNRTQIRTALGCFLFHGDDVFKTIDCLSGGEKVRLSFVKLMLQSPNFLILDEPTNHLDIAGKEALEASLSQYNGTMLFVSHDRYFISQIANKILVIDQDQAKFYPLTYKEYMNKDQEVKVETKKEQEVKKTEYVKPLNIQKEINKLEKQIETKENELEDLREMRFLPEYYHDYQKMNDLDSLIDDKHNEIEPLLKQWEEYSELLAE
ncbi:MAG: ABC-F type ribosomal protection protein [Erysipelotrichaceae bacterium]